MNEQLFNYIVSMQHTWAEDYKLQEQIKRKEYNKKVREQRWYGNSKEYKRKYNMYGAMFNK